MNKRNNSKTVGGRFRLVTALAVAACVVVGCASAPVWVPPGVQAAACTAVVAQPKAETYLRLAGQALKDLGGQVELPSAKDVEARLTTIPMGGLTEDQARMIWGSVLGLWDGICGLAKNPEQIAKAKALLRDIGEAMETGARTCAPPPAVSPSGTALAARGAAVESVEPVRISGVAEAVAKELRAFR